MNTFLVTLRKFLEKNQGRLTQLWYAPILALAMGLMFIRILVYAKLLAVSEFAIYSAGILVSGSFLMLGCLGFQSLLQRELPIMIMRRRESAGAILLMQCVLITLVCAALSTGIVVVSSFTLAGLSPLLIALSLIHGLSMQIFLVASVESRSRGQTLRFAQQNLYRATVMLFAAGIVAAVVGDAVAVLITEMLSSFVMSAVLLRQQFNTISIKLFSIIALAWTRLSFNVWRSALMLLAVSSISFIVLNADRWVAARLLIPSEFAQYAFGWTILMVAQSVQLVINSSLFPLLARRFASHGTMSAFSASARFSFIVLISGIVAIWPLHLLLDYSINRWFANYQDARGLFLVFLIISVLRLSDFWSSYLIVIGREKQLLMINLIGLIVGGGGWWFFSVSVNWKLVIEQIALLSLFLTITVYIFAAWAAWYFSGNFKKFVT